jgi:hypothetical protein
MTAAEPTLGGVAPEAEEKKAFDLFELLTALLLGFAAIGAAIAGLQAGQWGGKQLEAFSEANTLTTKAATQYNEDTVLMNADYAAIAQAKQHILEARDAQDPQGRERHLDMASYIYTMQLSENAYKAMELPMEYYVEDEEDAAQAPAAGAAPAPAAGAAQPAAASAAPDAAAEEDAEEDAEPEAALEREIPDEEIVASLQNELDEDYIDKMLEQGTKMFADADAKFGEGRQANENGDKFDLAGVVYAVALFFAGVGLVFKSSIRWMFFVMGVIVFGATTGYVATLPWAG